LRRVRATCVAKDKSMSLTLEAVHHVDD